MASQPNEPVPPAADIELIEAEAWAELQLALPQEMRSRLAIRVQRIAGAVLLLSSAPAVAINRVIGLGLVAPLSERQLDAICAEYSAAGVERFLVQWSPAGEPSRVPEWLADRGFAIVSRMAKLYRRTDAAPGEVVADPEMKVIEIGPSDAEAYERVVAAPLGVPDGLGPGIRSTIGRQGWRYYMVLDRQRPIAGAALYVRGQHGWFGLGATMEGDRRRGAQTALLARRLRDAAADGCVWVSADTLVETIDRPNPSYRNMRRAGFATLYERPNFLLDVRGAPSTARPSA